MESSVKTKEEKGRERQKDRQRDRNIGEKKTDPNCQLFTYHLTAVMNRQTHHRHHHDHVNLKAARPLKLNRHNRLTASRFIVLKNFKCTKTKKKEKIFFTARKLPFEAVCQPLPVLHI